jgi:hypothetical protein
MSARRNRWRVARLFQGRFCGQFIWRSTRDLARDRVAPVGREFGSPDYERLMREDFDKRQGVFSPDLVAQAAPKHQRTS